MEAIRVDWTDDRLDALSERMDERFDRVEEGFKEGFNQLNLRFDGMQRALFLAAAGVVAALLGVIGALIAT